MFLPHITALTILLKLSSRRIIAAAYLATSVPAIPIANPIILILILYYINIIFILKLILY
jgi:hypothetical protein